MNLVEYEAWINQALPGDRIVYHEGELARDRGRYGPKMEWIPAPLHFLAGVIYEDAELGLVELTQHPLPGLTAATQFGLVRRFEYRATRTSKEM